MGWESPEMASDVLPVTVEEVNRIKSGFEHAFYNHPEVIPSEFWRAWPSLRHAIDALPHLGLWRNLAEEFRPLLVFKMQSVGVPLPEEFLRTNPWLLDLSTDSKGNRIHDYGFEVERRKLPR